MIRDQERAERDKSQYCCSRECVTHRSPPAVKSQRFKPSQQINIPSGPLEPMPREKRRGSPLLIESTAAPGLITSLSLQSTILSRCQAARIKENLP